MNDVQALINRRKKQRLQQELHQKLFSWDKGEDPDVGAAAAAAGAAEEGEGAAPPWAAVAYGAIDSRSFGMANRRESSRHVHVALDSQELLFPAEACSHQTPAAIAAALGGSKLMASGTPRASAGPPSSPFLAARATAEQQHSSAFGAPAKHILNHQQFAGQQPPRDNQTDRGAGGSDLDCGVTRPSAAARFHSLRVVNAVGAEGSAQPWAQPPSIHDLMSEIGHQQPSISPWIQLPQPRAPPPRPWGLPPPPGTRPRSFTNSMAEISHQQPSVNASQPGGSTGAPSAGGGSHGMVGNGWGAPAVTSPAAVGHLKSSLDEMLDRAAHGAWGRSD